jgi:MoxR-like ATPase
MELAEVRAVAARLKEQVHRVVIGQDEAVDLLVAALLCEGHVLLEGVPGTAKTLLARAFSSCLSLDFRRIQFTPDLMPGDVLGTSLFNFATQQFTLTRGPIFTEVLLADEVNRTPPKTQAALLQAMQERVVTLDGQPHELSPAFMVIATQNPIEQEGTYPLPEAQLDRFLFKVVVGYPAREQELAMVRLHGHRSSSPKIEEFALERIADRDFLAQARAVVGRLTLTDPVVGYVVDLVRATREHPELAYGASPRSANMLAVAARAIACLEGRDYVVPDDVKRVARPLLRHRITLAPAAELDGATHDGVVGKILDAVPAPR